MSTHNIMFSWRNKKEYQYFSVETGALFQAILSNFFTFIDHKSRMTQIDSLEFHFFITCLEKKVRKKMFLK